MKRLKKFNELNKFLTIKEILKEIEDIIFELNEYNVFFKIGVLKNYYTVGYNDIDIKMISIGKHKACLMLDLYGEKISKDLYEEIYSSINRVLNYLEIEDINIEDIWCIIHGEKGRNVNIEGMKKIINDKRKIVDLKIILDLSNISM